jgi:hypothetical protein
MRIYGLLGRTHGGARVLTVMSPAGARAALEFIQADDTLITQASEGHLTRYLEKREGALQRLVMRHGIVLLAKADWDRKKARLGARIWD